MNEQRFASFVRQYLTRGARDIGAADHARLRAGRELALAHMAEAAPRWELAFAGLQFRTGPRRAPGWGWLGPVTALIIALSGAHYWQGVDRPAEPDEVDSALLADDLPIQAYLDQRFDAWVSHSPD